MQKTNNKWLAGGAVEECSKTYSGKCTYTHTQNKFQRRRRAPKYLTLAAMAFISQFVRQASRRATGIRPILQRHCPNPTNHSTMDTTVHSAGIAEIHHVPMSVIKRPIPSVLDEQKVASLMETIKHEESEAEEVPPIDLLWITGSEGGDYYFSFGGCHRFEAYKRLQRETIKAKLVRSTLGDLYHYMGSSAPKYLA
ncbi:sulfiredoxin isoform X1 [Drosophila kikkawai]|uniref:sulfiredoxin n=2 Tax=Drosophila kikkawai TaxID=30033 RepID=A0A6P4JLG4_DROKI|nr:putative sulfiredoxin isoform X1 [Drosophila kikkawai]XP_017036496.1 putative sulfiredoxin isoform X1 [Drosophila kikkawai]